MDISRRRFLSGRNSGGALFRPPWSVAEDLFVNRCTRCDDCLKSYPEGLLFKGGGGFPVVDFSKAACTFCGKCGEVCASGAIVRDPDARPWRVEVEISEACLAARQAECRICGEACGAGAIRFRLRVGGVASPEISQNACTGCGACVAPCPAGAVKPIVRSFPSTVFESVELA